MRLEDVFGNPSTSPQGEFGLQPVRHLLFRVRHAQFLVVDCGQHNQTAGAQQHVAATRRGRNGGGAGTPTRAGHGGGMVGDNTSVDMPRHRTAATTTAPAAATTTSSSAPSAAPAAAADDVRFGYP